MHVLANGLFLKPSHNGGTTTFVRGLVPAMAQRLGQAALSLVVSGAEAKNEAYRTIDTYDLRFNGDSPAARFLLQQTALWPIARKSGATCLMHFGNYVARGNDLPQYVVIHDAFLWSRHAPAGTSYRVKRSLQASAARRASAVFTVSEFSKREISAQCDVHPSKITVLGNALSPSFLRQMREPSIRPAAPVPYLLFVGQALPHKRVDRMLQLFSRIRARYRCQLKLVGRGQTEWWQAHRHLCEYPDDVAVDDFVSERHLIDLYRAAACFATLSDYEGFCIPILEAQGCSCPVVAPDAEPFREIAGGGALFLDRHDLDLSAELVLELLHSRTDRAQLVTRGRANLARYSWELLAQRAIARMQECDGTGVCQ
jgi:glycosyltransferase involved in cell wall biosynthesis